MDFELFCQSNKKIMEEYSVYECERNNSHIVEILDSEKYNPDAPCDGYKRYNVEPEKTDKRCPICNHALEYLGDDSTEYPDWFLHYRRYICEKNLHIVRARGGKTHNDRPNWEAVDKALFGYSKSEDDNLR